MLRVVLDANVYISAIIRPEGPPGRIVERFLREATFEIVLSPAIVEETLQDPDDDKYLAAAIEGSATRLVTGDPDLLTLKEHHGVRIVTPRVFLDLLGR